MPLLWVLDKAMVMSNNTHSLGALSIFHIHSCSLPLFPTSLACRRSYVNLQRSLSSQMANMRRWGAYRYRHPPLEPSLVLALTFLQLVCQPLHALPSNFILPAHSSESHFSLSIHCLSDLREVLCTLNLKHQNKLSRACCLISLKDIEIRTDVLNKQGQSVPEGH